MFDTATDVTILMRDPILSADARPGILNLRFRETGPAALTVFFFGEGQAERVAAAINAALAEPVSLPAASLALVEAA